MDKYAMQTTVYCKQHFYHH